MPRIRRRDMPVDTVELARFLIGKQLLHAGSAGLVGGRIVETEAYPPGDPTGYARFGLTTSNAPLFAKPGTAYVRMLYGTCLTLDLAAEPEGKGAAVLIRALEPTHGIDIMCANRPASRLRDLARGPGRICAAMNLGFAHNWMDLTSSRVLWLATETHPGPGIVVSTRIGLSRDQHRRLRFLERGSPFVSVPP